MCVASASPAPFGRRSLALNQRHAERAQDDQRHIKKLLPVASARRTDSLCCTRSRPSRTTLPLSDAASCPSTPKRFASRYMESRPHESFVALPCCKRPATLILKYPSHQTLQSLPPI